MVGCIFNNWNDIDYTYDNLSLYLVVIDESVVRHLIKINMNPKYETKKFVKFCTFVNDVIPGFTKIISSIIYIKSFEE